jgi:NRPS condensation-like uncharacterized protein
MTPPATTIAIPAELKEQQWPAPQSAQVAADILPLRLTPFERYMTLDDRPNYPMTFAAALELRGAVSPEALQQAVASLGARHPLIEARLSQSGRKSAWKASRRASVRVEWCDTPPEPLAFDRRKLDLSREAPLRVEAYSQGGRTRLLFSFHHAMCDGKGASQVIGDVLAAYGMATADTSQQPRLLPTQVDLLSQRGELQLTLPAPLTSWQIFQAFCAETWKFITRRPTPLRTTSVAEAQENANQGLLAVHISQETFRRFSQHATAQEATANDLLIRDLFCTMRSWHKEMRCNKSRRWLRMTIPTNLRSRRDQKMPAANILGYAFLTRREGECDSSDSFLQGLASEMRAICKWAMGAMFLQGVRVVDMIPGGLFLCTRLSRSFSTIVLSNVGDPTRRFRAVFPRDAQQRLVAGNLVLESISMAPPVRPGTRIAIAVTTYGETVTLGAQYDHTCMTTDEARRFLDLYVSHIEKSSQCSSD